MRRFAFAAALLALAPAVRAADVYEEIAQKLSERASNKLKESNGGKKGKVAVLPFDYLDGRRSPGGLTVATKLQNRIVEIDKLDVIERSQVEKILGEIKFQGSGAIDPETAKQLGKGLGVDAIVTGTLEDDKRARYTEINAKVIQTETFVVLAGAQGKVEKTWQEESPQIAEGPQPSEPAYQRPTARRRSGRGMGFFDFFLGAGGSKMDMEFSNPRFPISQTELSFSGVTPTPFTSISFTDLETKGAVPVGIRVGGFGEVIGGAFEMSAFSHAMKPQGTTHAVNGINKGAFTFTSDEYLKVSVFNLLSGDLFVRFPTGPDVFPYLGIGMGLSLNTVQSPFIKTLQGGTLRVPLEETAPGFMFRIPFGVRFRVADRIGLFTEGRFFMNKMSFDRGIASEDDSVTLKGFQFLGGLSILF